MSNYHRYGGRSIKVCDEWRDSYVTFRDWAMSHGYKEGLQIHRINNDGDYEPNNCKFVTCRENIWHKKETKLNIRLVQEIRDKYMPRKYSQRRLGEEYNLSHQHISDIINYKRWAN
jgi:hypothetical protein